MHLSTHCTHLLDLSGEGARVLIPLKTEDVGYNFQSLEEEAMRLKEVGWNSTWEVVDATLVILHTHLALYYSCGICNVLGSGTGRRELIGALSSGPVLATYFAGQSLRHNSFHGYRKGSWIVCPVPLSSSLVEAFSLTCAYPLLARCVYFNTLFPSSSNLLQFGAFGFLF